mmetsp:Transcript_6269/g.28311  ORF Transcript_6269/g.28311 Transcript_6269/m.28311 type:complete len:370 (+) Transcript_6269:322-1431(+)
MRKRFFIASRTSPSRLGFDGQVGGEVVGARARRERELRLVAERLVRRILRLGIALDPAVQLQQRQARELVLQAPVQALARPAAVSHAAAARASAKLVPPRLHPPAQRVRARVRSRLEHVAANLRVVPVQEEPCDGRRGEMLLRGVLRGGAHLGGGGDCGVERVDVVALSQTFLHRTRRDGRRDDRGVHRGCRHVRFRSLREEFATELNVLLDAEPVLQAVTELALGGGGPEEDVPPGAERGARFRVLVLALAAAAVEVHDGEGVVRVGGAGDGGASEERSPARAPSLCALLIALERGVSAVKVDAADEKGGEDAAGVDGGFGEGGRALVPVLGGRLGQDLLADVGERALAHARVAEALGREHCVEILAR